MCPSGSRADPWSQERASRGRRARLAHGFLDGRLPRRGQVHQHRTAIRNALAISSASRQSSRPWYGRLWKSRRQRLQEVSHSSPCGLLASGPGDRGAVGPLLCDALLPERVGLEHQFLEVLLLTEPTTVARAVLEFVRQKRLPDGQLVLLDRTEAGVEFSRIYVQVWPPPVIARRMRRSTTPPYLPRSAGQQRHRRASWPCPRAARRSVSGLVGRCGSWVRCRVVSSPAEGIPRTALPAAIRTRCPAGSRSRLCRRPR